MDVPWFRGNSSGVRNQFLRPSNAVASLDLGSTAGAPSFRVLCERVGDKDLNFTSAEIQEIEVRGRCWKGRARLMISPTCPRTAAPFETSAHNQNSAGSPCVGASCKSVSGAGGQLTNQVHSLPAQCGEVHLIDPFICRPAQRVQVELDVDARVITPTRWKRRRWSNQVDLGVDVVDT